jgi:hypothetical protein
MPEIERNPRTAFLRAAPNAPFAAPSPPGTMGNEALCEE